MVRCELVDVSTGKRYVRRDESHSCQRRANLGRCIRQQRRITGARDRGPRSRGPAKLTGPLLLLLGAIGLLMILHAHADHMDAVLLAVTCLAAIFIGACTMRLRSAFPAPRRS